MKHFAIYILTFLLFPFKTVNKKEALLLISKEYFPDNYVLLKEYPDSFFDFLLKGDSISEYVFGLTTIVHEAFHLYESAHNSSDTIRQYRINDSLTIFINKFSSYPCLEINKIAPPLDRQKVFRYNTYINNKDIKHDTQQHGFLGLIGENVAYYQEFKAYNALFKFLKDKYGWADAELWRRYLGETGSVRYSLLEFKLFISWYLQFAKTAHPTIYKKIISDKNIQKIYTLLESEGDRLTKEYDSNRTEIIKQLGQKAKVLEGNFTVIKSGFSTGLHDKEMQNMIFLLSKPEHKILTVLKTSQTK
jgi:hypothetical protein